MLTHGFTMDAKGMKMSKSLGNTVNPLDLMKEYGADILRLWALSVDFTEDHRIGKEILAGVADQYRKLRNTFRYLLGALDGFSEEERLDDVAAYPELERYMLHLTAELDEKLRKAVDDFDFNTYVRALTDFCNEDLSRLLLRYPQGQPLLRREPETGFQTERRRAYRTVLDTLFHALVRWLAPVLVFTSEEVWGTRYPGRGVGASARMAGGAAGRCRRREVGRAARAAHAGHRGDRAAAPRQGRSDRASRPKSRVPELPRHAGRARRAVHHLDSSQGR